jgi:hypothetical protein
MMRRILFLLGICASLLAAPIQTRRVLPKGAGPQRLEADLALLARASRDLHDLRLFDAAGRECPYVLVPPSSAAPDWKGGRLLALPSSKERSGFELDLGAVLPSERLRVEGLPKPFLKRYRLEASGDRERWTEVVKDGTLFDLPEERLQFLQCDFPRGAYRYFRLVWDDRSSAKIPLPRAASVLRAAMGSAAPLLERISFAARVSEPGASRFVLRLPGRSLPLSALRLELGGSGPLLRGAVVNEPRLQDGRLLPRNLGRAELRRAERGGLPAASFRIPIGPAEGAELELLIENGANPAIELKSVLAEAEPQPWIYFESVDRAPLEARYGDAKLPQPRYDLEALREKLATAETGTAKWDGSATVAFQPRDMTLDPGPGAASDPNAFRQLREVPPSQPGLVALLLDPHVLASSPSFSDLRILDGQGRQVPYLLEQRDEPLEATLSLPQPARQDRASFYLLSLPQPRLPRASLVLEAEGRTFRREIRVEEVLASGGERVLAHSLWEHADAGGPATLALPLGPLQTGTLRLVIDEGDNQPLQLKSARLLLPAWRLRFFHPGDPLRLGYGAELAAPQYDLALLADRLRSVPVKELSLGPAASTGSASAATQTRLFWGILVAAVVALLFMLGRLLKHPTDPNSS